jgi:hypothetical protein
MPIWGQVLFLLVASLVVFGVTALATVSFGRRVARRSRLLAILACAATVPLLIVAVAIILAKTAPTGPLSNDGQVMMNDAPVMVYVALLTMAALSCVISVPASVLLILRAA